MYRLNLLLILATLTTALIIYFSVVGPDFVFFLEGLHGGGGWDSLPISALHNGLAVSLVCEFTEKFSAGRKWGFILLGWLAVYFSIALTIKKKFSRYQGFIFLWLFMLFFVPYGFNGISQGLSSLVIFFSIKRKRNVGSDFILFIVAGLLHVYSLVATFSLYLSNFISSKALVVAAFLCILVGFLPYTNALVQLYFPGKYTVYTGMWADSVSSLELIMRIGLLGAFSVAARSRVWVSDAIGIHEERLTRYVYVGHALFFMLSWNDVISSRVFGFFIFSDLIVLLVAMHYIERYVRGVGVILGVIYLMLKSKLFMDAYFAI